MYKIQDESLIDKIRSFVIYVSVRAIARLIVCIERIVLKKIIIHEPKYAFRI